MTSQEDRRKEDVLNLVTKWVVIVCFPSILALGGKLLLALGAMDKHITKLEQRFDDSQLANQDANQRLQAHVSDIDARLTNHLIEHWRRAK